MLLPISVLVCGCASVPACCMTRHTIPFMQVLASGQSFGEIALFQQEVGLRSASVRAKGGFVELLKLTKDDYTKVLLVGSCSVSCLRGRTSFLTVVCNRALPFEIYF